jgi:hypothetical protein
MVESNKIRRNANMKRIILLFTVVCCFTSGFSCIGSETDKLFNKALKARGQDYYNAREAFLKSADKKQLIEFLDSKLADKKSTILEKALANILKEHLEKQEKIKAFIRYNPYVENAKELKEKGEKYAPIVGYSHQAKQLVLDKYQECDCPYAIMEYIWKNPDLLWAYSRNHEVINILTVYYDSILKQNKKLPANVREMYIEIFKNRVENYLANGTHQKASSEYRYPEQGSIEGLTVFDSKKNFPIVYAWVAKQKPGRKNTCAGFYFPMLAEKKDLPQLEKYLNDKANWVDSSGKPNNTFKTNLEGIIEYLKNGKKVDDRWVKNFLNRSRGCVRFPLAQDFIFSIRPDLKDRIQLKHNGRRCYYLTPTK